MNKNLQAALAYLNKYHFSVIPCDKQKKPLIKWQDYQKKLPTEDEVKKWWEQWPDANITLVTGLISNIVVIDADLYKMTDEQKETFEQTIPENLVTPMTNTPRGGKHYYFSYISNPCQSKGSIIPHVDIKAEGGLATLPPSSNGTGISYKWQLSIKDTPLQALPERYKELINSFSLYKGADKKPTECPQVSGSVHNCLVEGRRNDDIFHVANCLAKGKTDFNDMWQVLEILAKNCNPPFPESEIKTIIQSALDRVARKERNLTQEVRDWVLSTSGGFLSTDVYNCLVLSTRQDKKMVSEVLRRLCDDKIIERFGNKNGQFRKIETDIDYINWYDADETSCLPIIYPLDLHTYALTCPKNIVIIAGSKDAGKTAFLLNIAALNRDNLKIHYFTSEMGEVELKKRNINISKSLNIPLKEIRDKISWIDRADNFPDLIFPEDVNIIDFLEITKDFYEVSDMIRNIHRKLTTGIAIIAIQKPSSRDMPIGGEKGLEKARIAIAIDNNRAKILVGKNWATDTNPKGLECRFHILKGSEIRMSEMWDKKEQKEGRLQ